MRGSEERGSLDSIVKVVRELKKRWAEIKSDQELLAHEADVDRQGWARGAGMSSRKWRTLYLMKYENFAEARLRVLDRKIELKRVGAAASDAEIMALLNEIKKAYDAEVLAFDEYSNVCTQHNWKEVTGLSPNAVRVRGGPEVPSFKKLFWTAEKFAKFTKKYKDLVALGWPSFLRNIQ
jgi:hypothetical protein